MLEKQTSDTEIVRAWLADALTGADATGRRAELARLCDVRPQAVSGWLKTGRITKKNLELATAFFGHGPSFTTKALTAREQAARYFAVAKGTSPPVPPRDFADRHLISATDWALLQDVKAGASAADLAAIRERAATVRLLAAEYIAGLGKPDVE